MDDHGPAGAAALDDLGLVAVSGADARAFLHAQLTNDILHLPARQARRAGWCSAQGRLLATLLVLPQGDRFLLHTDAGLVPSILKRLQMFVLRSRVALADASREWAQFGLWGPQLDERCAALGVALPAAELGLAESDGLLAVRVGPARGLLLVEASSAAAVAAQLRPAAAAAAWALQEIRDGWPRIVPATQELFVPQMVNLQLIQGVDFQKGCYPGQEVVARTQYRGQLKRRMVRVRSARLLQPGQALFAGEGLGEPCGNVVHAAGGEALAVIAIAALEAGASLRLTADGEPLELLPLPRLA